MEHLLHPWHYYELFAAMASLPVISWQARMIVARLKTYWVPATEDKADG